MQTCKRTPSDLLDIKKETERERFFEKGSLSARITVHLGACGIASGADRLIDFIQNAVRRSGRTDIAITTSGCIGLCSLEPLITVENVDGHPIIYKEVDETVAKQIFEYHVQQNNVVLANALAWGFTSDSNNVDTTEKVEGTIPHISKLPFFAMQQSLVLSNRGIISPDHIEDYILKDGYQAAQKALLDLTPEQIIDEIKVSGLRGRGGGGFPTGIKWAFAASVKSDVKYVLCNADEGDPGAFMDRSVMEADPHKVVEGMIIAARAIGAHMGFIYCRAEYPLALEKLERAIHQANADGLLGQDILGSGFDFNLEIYMGAGAFVCGEETALIASIQGERGIPRPRPPFPATSGLWGKPTILNNVETYANVPGIIRNGGESYAGIGTAGSKGTKVFALTGKVRRTGLVEVPMGTSLGDIIFSVGGGIPGDKTFKAAQLGGPSGGCLPASSLNTKTDYEEIVKAGAIMGSGGLIVMDDDTCMVDMARYFMAFCQEESCGKCTPCRVGTKRMLQILERICAGNGEDGDIELLTDLAHGIRDTALCGLGQTAPNPVLSTLENFRHEYVAHIRDKHCDATACTKLFKSPCQHACPAGMDIPTYVALIQQGRIDDAWEVIKQTNPFPGICGRVCSHPCQLKCRRGELDAPVAIRALKRFVADHVSNEKVEALPFTRSEAIAVVGAGPSGLTAAWELRKRGYPVTLFDDQPEPGGMLRYGIPPYRLPREVLDGEIKAILDLGIEYYPGIRIGRDTPLNRLLEEYHAVFLAVGAHRSLMPGIPGEGAKGVWGAVPFLHKANQEKLSNVGKRVVVIGGGSSSMDAARTARRLGAEKVTVAYRRTRTEMPAMLEEIESAEAEGVEILELTSPTEIIKHGDRVKGVVLSNMMLGDFDAGGRRRPMPREGSTRCVDADTVIMAIGNSSEITFLDPLGDQLASENEIAVDDGQHTNDERIFAGGDVSGGPALVIYAIRDGRKAASSIDEAIRSRNGEPTWRAPMSKQFSIPLNSEDVADDNTRFPEPEIAPVKRILGFQEVVQGYTAEMAVREAKRCLRCDQESYSCG